MTSTVASPPSRSLQRTALVTLVGTSIEWFDFFLYVTAAALVFPALFFAADLPPLVAMMASFSTVTVGFIARPIGAILFGHIGDKVGRKRALVISLVLMGLATTLIGCLPTHAQVGSFATAALILLRFLQGISIGGQWGGAVLLATESAPAGKRGLYGSFPQIGAPAGLLLANFAFLLVNALLTPADFLSWGWRLPFLSSVLLVGLALYVQLRFDDSPAFLRARSNATEDPSANAPAHRWPIIELLRAYPRQVILGAGAFLAITVSYYAVITFVVAYGASPAGLGLPRATMLGAVLAGAVVSIPAIVWSASISDRVGRRGIYMAGAGLLGIWAFALFPMIETRSVFWITLAVCVAQVLNGVMYGPLAAMLSEQFGTRVRYSGVSLGYQLGSILGGGLAPLVATALLAKFGDTFWIAVYIAAACAATLVSVALMQDRHRSSFES